jgi:hypothetical protein
MNNERAKRGKGVGGRLRKISAMRLLNERSFSIITAQLRALFWKGDVTNDAD